MPYSISRMARSGSPAPSGGFRRQKAGSKLIWRKELRIKSRRYLEQRSEFVI